MTAGILRGAATALGFVLCLLWCAPARALLLDTGVILRQEAGVCAVTFDDGPTQYTAALLDALRAEGIRATFFVLGKQVRYRPQLLQRMVEEGHEVATHGYNHIDMRKASAQARFNDLAISLEQLRELGITTRLFRPPYGRFDEALTAMTNAMGLSLIMWTTDSRDWKQRPADYRSLPSTIGRTLPQAEMRGVFLFHDTRPGTVADLGKIVADLRESGCTRFVTVSEYMDSLPPPGVLHASKGKSKGKTANSRQDTPRMTLPAAAHAAIAMVMVPAAPQAITVALADQAPTAPHKPDVTQTTVLAQHALAAGPPSRATPAGTTPVPMARSSSPWNQLPLLRSVAQGT